MAYNPNFRGNVAKASSRQNKTGYQNGTGSTITQTTPVSKTGTTNHVAPTDVSDEDSVERFVGLFDSDTPSAASNLVVTDGRAESIPSSLGFAIGDTLWLGPTPGSLTNVKPDLSAPGWASGMFVVFIGVVVENEFNSSQLDIQLCRAPIGQL